MHRLFVAVLAVGALAVGAVGIATGPASALAADHHHHGAVGRRIHHPALGWGLGWVGDVFHHHHDFGLHFGHDGGRGHGAHGHDGGHAGHGRGH